MTAPQRKVLAAIAEHDDGTGTSEAWLDYRSRGTGPESFLWRNYENVLGNLVGKGLVKSGEITELGRRALEIDTGRSRNREIRKRPTWACLSCGETFEHRDTPCAACGGDTFELMPELEIK